MVDIVRYATAEVPGVRLLRFAKFASNEARAAAACLRSMMSRWKD